MSSQHSRRRRRSSWSEFVVERVSNTENTSGSSGTRAVSSAPKLSSHNSTHRQLKLHPMAGWIVGAQPGRNIDVYVSFSRTSSSSGHKDSSSSSQRSYRRELQPPPDTSAHCSTCTDEDEEARTRAGSDPGRGTVDNGALPIPGSDAMPYPFQFDLHPGRVCVRCLRDPCRCSHQHSAAESTSTLAHSANSEQSRRPSQRSQGSTGHYSHRSNRHSRGHRSLTPGTHRSSTAVSSASASQPVVITVAKVDNDLEGEYDDDRVDSDFTVGYGTFGVFDTMTQLVREGRRHHDGGACNEADLAHGRRSRTNSHEDRHRRASAEVRRRKPAVASVSPGKWKV